MQVLLTIASLLVLGIGLWAGYGGRHGVLTVGFLAFASLLFVTNLDRISEFKASTTGVEAKTREVLARAENTLTELQVLAKRVAAVTLSLVKRSGRLGGYSDDEETAIRESVLEVLRQVGIPESEFSDVLSEWHKFTEFDYARAILGGGYVPEGVEPVVIEEWKQLRRGGINEIPSPEQIRQFLKKHGFMNGQLEEYLKDYEHYKKYRTHRRPEVWRQRSTWGRLKKP